MKPANLNTLADQVNQKYLSWTFRFRDVTANLDYLTSEISKWQWGRDGTVRMINALLLDGGACGYYPLGGKEERYALLSSPDELRWFSRIGFVNAANACKRSYGPLLKPKSERYETIWGDLHDAGYGGTELGTMTRPVEGWF